MIFVGIDPGLSGGLVAITPKGRLVSALIMPRVNGSKGPLDVRCVWSWLLDLAPPNQRGNPGQIAAALERVQVRPGEGARSARTAGVNWGSLHGLLIAAGARFETPTPRQWQKVVTPGQGDPKSRSIEAARRLFPDLDLTPGRRTKPHDGLSDGACLAEWARRTLGDPSNG